jgi:hypothetical protein
MLPLRMSVTAFSLYIFSSCNLILVISYRDSRPIVDLENCIFAVYVGMPFDTGYMEACACICEFNKTELERNEFHPKGQSHNQDISGEWKGRRN